MKDKRKIKKCDVCKQNRVGCKRRIYGYERRFYLACEECREEMKLTARIISITAREIVRKKPYEFTLLIKRRKIFGITRCIPKS
ncbi:MAG: hypothetical protein WC315_06985 [Candidatus Omnitrophota bacterium]